MASNKKKKFSYPSRKINKSPAAAWQGPKQDEINALIEAFVSHRYLEVEALSRKMLDRFPRFALGWKALGASLKQMGRISEALAPMQKSVELLPNDAEAYNNLGAALQDIGRFSEAETVLRRAIELKTDYIEAHNNLGNVLKNLGKIAEAERSYRQAIALNPGYAEAHSNIGALLKDTGQLTEAEKCFRQAITLNPSLVEAHNNLGSTLQTIGRFSEAEISLRRAIEIKPDFANAHSNLLFGMNYNGELSPAARLAEAKYCGELLSSKVTDKYNKWNCESSANKINIGFVSGDLRNHPVGFFLEGLLSNIDRSSYSLTAFPTAPLEDELTARIKPLFAKWIPLFGKNDKNAAAIIHKEGINVLIDLAGHTAHNRLAVFAFKPAPVQVSWLGYLATTGIPEIDYVIGDPYVTPPAEDHHFVERIWRLPETYICFSPPNEDIQVKELPALTNGYLTFGCFNNLAKLNNTVICAWSDILNAVKNSKLFLRTKQLSDKTVAEETKKRFAAFGINTERLIIEGHSLRVDYFNAFNCVDIALDPFPYTGTTTSIEGLWMGVPFITKHGDRFLSHSGESIAINAGLAEWIAENEEDYIKKAICFSSDVQGLSMLRLDLRKKVLSSPLFDAKRFARHFEESMSGMWNKWLRE